MQLDRSAALRSNIKQILHLRGAGADRACLQRGEAGPGQLVWPGHFLSPDSIINLLRSAVPILTLSGAFTLLMISGYIDLSVGSAMSLSAVVFAWMILNGFSFLPAFSSP